MASELNLDINMKSSDLIKKKPLDYGGFGEVYLCYHKTLGHVVMKTVYTGPQRNEVQRQSLLEEGTLMQRLSHERVVQLLGVILEEGDYALVMELVPKGNLLNMLHEVAVPLSLKGRIITEILEGMLYLTQHHVIHKDLKPENLLLDDDFHIKIADLGLAICKLWGRLTKEESRRRSTSGRSNCAPGAGTLSYMAPEHLESIHATSTEKSDVYSFAIVVWVILTNREPYENARSDDHICQCVRKGDRPDDETISDDTPEEIISLMKRCWHQNPTQRPTFKESYESFLPYYKAHLEKDVEQDCQKLKVLYTGPKELVEWMTSLQISTPDSDASDKRTMAPYPTDSPASLRSSEMAPVEASIEDLVSPDGSSLEVDAAPASILQKKLIQELDYHRNGSYSQYASQQPSSAHFPTQSPPLAPQAFRPAFSPTQPQQPHIPSVAHHNGQRMPLDLPCQVSSVQSWAKPDPVCHSPEDSAPMAATGGPFIAGPSLPNPYYQTQLSGGNLYSHPSTPVDRNKSWPHYPIPESARQPWSSNAYNGSGFSPSLDPIHIVGGRAIQIGHNNTMSIQAPDSILTPANGGAANNELLLKYSDHAVTEKHLELLRDNIGSNWKTCARRLGLTDVEVDTIDHDYNRDGLSEKVHQMLARWRMKEGCIGCTVGRLYNALTGTVKVDLLQRLLHICGESVG